MGYSFSKWEYMIYAELQQMDEVIRLESTMENLAGLGKVDREKQGHPSICK